MTAFQARKVQIRKFSNDAVKEYSQFRLIRTKTTWRFSFDFWRSFELRGGFNIRDSMRCVQGVLSELNETRELLDVELSGLDCTFTFTWLYHFSRLKRVLTSNIIQMLSYNFLRKFSVNAAQKWRNKRTLKYSVRENARAPLEALQHSGFLLSFPCAAPSKVRVMCGKKTARKTKSRGRFMCKCYCWLQTIRCV